MASKPRDFEEGGYYHIFNRGVEKRTTFLDEGDYRRFLSQLAYYQQKNRGDKYSRVKFRIKDRSEPLLFDIFCYCLMPNHFHLLVKARDNLGVSQGLSRLLNAYTRAFNTRYHRVGGLFQGKFQSVHIYSQEQLLQVFRYILLNPYIAKLCQKPSEYKWSAYQELLSKGSHTLIDRGFFIDHFPDLQTFTKFITDYQDYAEQLHISKKLWIDIDE